MGLECEMVRFKDDYRILVKDESEGRRIVKALQAALGEFDLELSDDKTSIHVLPEGLFRSWVSLYHAVHPRKRCRLCTWWQIQAMLLQQPPQGIGARRHPLPADPVQTDQGVVSKNTNELKTGAPGRFDRHRPVASPRSGACRRRCRRFGFSVRAGKTPSSNGMPRSRAETWIQARAAPGPERASLLRPGSPGLDPGPLGWPLFGRRTAPGQRPAPLFGANVALENRG